MHEMIYKELLKALTNRDSWFYVGSTKYGTMETALYFLGKLESKLCEL